MIVDQNHTLKRQSETLLTETSDKRQKTEIMKDVSGCIAVMEVSDLVLDPARVTLSPNEVISSQYDLLREHLLPYLGGNALITLRSVTTQWKNHSEHFLIECLNNKTLLLKDYSFLTIDEVSAFFDKNCERITVLNLTGFEHISPSDIADLLDFFPNIEELTLNCSHEISRLSIFYLSQMKNLKKLEFNECSLPEDTLDEIEECQEEDCSWKLAKFPKLQELIIFNSDLPYEISPLLSRMKNLKILHFSSNSLNMQSKLHIESLYLKEITIQNAASGSDDCSYDDMHIISIDCLSLQKLVFDDVLCVDQLILNCPSLKEIKGPSYQRINNATINCFSLEDCDWIESISENLRNFSSSCPSVKKLSMNVLDCSEIFYNIPFVEELEIINYQKETKKITLFCPSLKKFCGYDTDNLRKFRISSSTEHLKSFSLENIESEDLSFLSNSTALEELTLGGFIEDFSALEHLTQLNRLDLIDCPDLTDISFLINMSKIETLNLKECFCIKNIQILTKIPSLKWLALGYKELMEITPDTDFEKIFDQYAEAQKEFVI